MCFFLGWGSVLVSYLMIFLFHTTFPSPWCHPFKHPPSLKGEGRITAESIKTSHGSWQLVFEENCPSPKGKPSTWKDWNIILFLLGGLYIAECDVSSWEILRVYSYYIKIIPDMYIYFLCMYQHSDQHEVRKSWLFELYERLEFQNRNPCSCWPTRFLGFPVAKMCFLTMEEHV